LPAIAPLATAGPSSVVPLTKEEERRPPVQPPLTHLLSVWLATRYALLTRTLNPADGPEHWRRLRELCADVVKLRHGDHTAERLRLDRRRLAAHVQPGETRESDRIRLNPTFESNPSTPFPGNGPCNGSRRNNRSPRAAGSRLSRCGVLALAFSLACPPSSRHPRPRPPQTDRAPALAVLGQGSLLRAG
jgi:hypothetical protein